MGSLYNAIRAKAGSMSSPIIREANGKLLPGSKLAAGVKPSRFFRRALLRDLMKDVDGVQRIDLGASAIVTKMCEGDVRAFEAIRDTVDGRPASDSENANVGIAVQIAFVDGASDTMRAAMRQAEEDEEL